MLDGVVSSAHIRGVVPHLVEDGVSNLQFADDTMIMVHNEPWDIMNLKFILLCFEAMSGLRINFAKSEVFVLGVEVEAQLRTAFMLYYKLRCLPMTYLGLPVDGSRLPMSAFDPSKSRVSKRVD